MQLASGQPRIIAFRHFGISAFRHFALWPFAARALRFYSSFIIDCHFAMHWLWLVASASPLEVFLITLWDWFRRCRCISCGYHDWFQALETARPPAALSNWPISKINNKCVCPVQVSAKKNRQQMPPTFNSTAAASPHSLGIQRLKFKLQSVALPFFKHFIGWMRALSRTVIRP